MSTIQPTNKSRIFVCLIITIMLVFCLATPYRAYANTWTVNTLLDENDGSCSDGDCSLRDAIQVAAAGDTINLWQITGTIVLTLGQLNIDKNLTLKGWSPESLTVSGNNSSRVFFVTSGNTTFLGMTIANGFVGDNQGGGIFNSGTTTLTNVTFSDNSAIQGGGIYNIGTTTLTSVKFIGNSTSEGGGIYNSGTATLKNITFSANSASLSGGGMFNDTNASTTLMNVTLTSNSANYGGGMRNDGSTTLTNVIFSSNSTDYSGGGMENWGTSTLMNVTFNANSGNTGSDGGGMRNDGTSIMTNVTFSGNSATNGGGMYSENTSTLTNVTFSDNSATIGGGVYIHDGSLILKNTLLSGNTAPTGPECAGTLTSYGYDLIQDPSGCTIVGDETGNIYDEDPLLGPLATNGGYALTHSLLLGSPAVNAADNTDPYGNLVTQDQRGFTRPQGPANDVGAVEMAYHIVDTLLDENDGKCSDGDCSLRDAIQVAIPGDTINFSATGTIVLTSGQLFINKDIAIRGPGPDLLTVSGNNSGRVFNTSGGNTIFSGLTIADGFRTGSIGAGMYNSGTTLLTNINFYDNHATDGSGDGGGGMGNDGTAILTDITFSENSAYRGGGIYNAGFATLTNVTFSHNSSTSGGGLCNNGTITLTNITFNDNSASNGGGGIYNSGISTLTNVTLNDNSSSDRGGGIYSAGTSTLFNVTISGNTARTEGGGIFNFTGALVTLTNVTIYANSAGFGGGVVVYGDGLILKNTILSGNIASYSPNCNDTLTSYGYNLIQDTAGCVLDGDEIGNIYGKDPLLGPLADNGGYTLTHALQPGSPAIDAANFTDPYGNPVTQDQRGVTRPQGLTNDIGAYELNQAHWLWLPLLLK